VTSSRANEVREALLDVLGVLASPDLAADLALRTRMAQRLTELIARMAP
jgi:hypothetical protein